MKIGVSEKGLGFRWYRPNGKKTWLRWEGCDMSRDARFVPSGNIHNDIPLGYLS